MDPIQRIEKSTELAGQIVGNVKADQLSKATPCAEMDLRGLLNHLLGGLEMLTTAAKGGKATMPETDLVGDGSDISARYDQRREQLLEAVRAPGVLEKTWAMPFGDLPGQMMAGIAFWEHLVHGWDVAKATGQDATIPEGLAQEAYDLVKPMDAMIRMPGVCGPAVPVPDDAPITDRLVGFLGRQP
jgi:uncharacterized protein (TIGR03086 family)